MHNKDSSYLEIFRCNIAERWTVDEMAKFILDVSDIYNLNFVVNSIHEKSTSSIDLSKLSNYIFTDEKLKILRFEYGSPGFIEVAGAAAAIIPFALILSGVNPYIKYKEMKIKRDCLNWEKEKENETEKINKIEKRLEELENEIERLEKQRNQLQNNFEIAYKSIKLGMPELEIRRLKNWVSQKINNIINMVDAGKIISAHTMQSNYMVKMPAGKFLYGKKKEGMNIGNDYLIDVFPVTNKQYEKFINDSGYNKKNYWSEEGVEWRQKDNIAKPKYWDNFRFNQPEHPVLGISYYEAEAYANWTGKRLPTEEEWERAARGTDGREYPWGNEFDTEKCSVGGSTTPVSQYPNGISPEGCYDMAGNVWEWTSSYYDGKRKNKVIRGGSWYDGAHRCRSAIRAYFTPGRRSVALGFRLARSVAPSSGTLGTYFSPKRSEGSE